MVKSMCNKDFSTYSVDSQYFLIIISYSFSFICSFEQIKKKKKFYKKAKINKDNINGRIPTFLFYSLRQLLY